MLVLVVIFGLLLIALLNWYLGNKYNTDEKNLIIVITVPLILYSLKKLIEWKRKIKTHIYIPSNYKKESVLIIYKQHDTKSIRANLGLVRKRILHFEENGMIRIQNNRNDIRIPRNMISIRYKNGRKFKENEHVYIQVIAYDFSGLECDLIVFNAHPKTTSITLKQSYPKEKILQFIRQKKTTANNV